MEHEVLGTRDNLALFSVCHYSPQLCNFFPGQFHFLFTPVVPQLSRPAWLCVLSLFQFAWVVHVALTAKLQSFPTSSLSALGQPALISAICEYQSRLLPTRTKTIEFDKWSFSGDTKSLPKKS